jgi:hypothetical protein
MNNDLLESNEYLKELMVRLYLLNNEVLFMNSPILNDQLQNLAKLEKGTLLQLHATEE